MDKIKQDLYRENLIKKYEESAFECLANYAYYGQKYKSIDKEIERLEDMIGQIIKQIKEISESADGHSVENRERIKALKKDEETYKAQIKSVSGAVKKFWEDAVKFREEGCSLLEKVENFKTFKVNTPEEIAADQEKAKPAAETEPKA